MTTFVWGLDFLRCKTADCRAPMPLQVAATQIIKNVAETHVINRFDENNASSAILTDVDFIVYTSVFEVKQDIF